MISVSRKKDKRNTHASRVKHKRNKKKLLNLQDKGNEKIKETLKLI